MWRRRTAVAILILIVVVRRRETPRFWGRDRTSDGLITIVASRQTSSWSSSGTEGPRLGPRPQIVRIWVRIHCSCGTRRVAEDEGLVDGGSLAVGVEFDEWIWTGLSADSLRAATLYAEGYKKSQCKRKSDRAGRCRNNYPCAGGRSSRLGGTLEIPGVRSKVSGKCRMSRTPNDGREVVVTDVGEDDNI